MNENKPEREALHLAEAVADGAEIDWRRMGSAEGVDSGHVRSFELIDSVLRDYGRSAEEVRAHLRAPLLPPDSRWGPLRVLEPIGSGAFGQVFRAFDRSLARDVALKVLRDPPRTGAAGVPEFLAEARRLARVRHPGVLTVLGVAVHDGRAGIWTELLRGRTLEEILASDGPFAPDEAARIGIALCEAVSAVHATGLIHRDLKTQNVMLEESGRVVLTDFGAMDERFDEDPTGKSAFGSLLSTAPEILRGGRASPASDVYALGVLLYRLLSGSYPIVAESPRELLQAMESGRPSLREGRPDAPEALAAAVDRALDPDPSRRFAGPNAMAQALRAALDPSLAAKPAPRESYRPPAPRDSMAAAIGVCLAICAAVFAGVLGFGVPWLDHHFRSPFPPEPPPTPAPVTRPVPSFPAGLQAVPVLHRLSSLGTEPLADGATIRAGDQLFLEVPTGAAPVYCWVIDEDGAGNDYVLFPLPGYRPRNPVAAAARHRLPDGVRGRTWAVDSENGRENVVLITSLDPLPWLERSIRDIPRASGGNDAPQMASRGVEGEVTRGMGRTAPPPPMGRLAAVLDRLRASGEFRAGRAGLWRIQLDSPTSP